MSQSMNQAPEAAQWPGIRPSGHPVWQEIKIGLVALSLANLAFISSWFTMLYDADFGYYNKFPVNKASLLALAVNISWLTALAWVFMRVLRRQPNRWLHLAVHVVFFFLLLLPLDFCRTFVCHISDYQLLQFLRKPAAFSGLLVLLAAILWQHRRVARFSAVLVGVLSPLALLTVTKTMMLCVGLEHLAQATSIPLLPPPGPVQEGRPRVVWIIFDEFDQRVAFDQRPSRVRMPEFDRLLQESLHATNAYSPAHCTLFSMPALISGHRFSFVSIKNDSDLSVTFADTTDTNSWREMPSVFSAARELGFNTALVGWFHPYDRVLGKFLNYCLWYPHPMDEAARASTFSAAMRREILCTTGTLHRRMLYLDICVDTLAGSLSLVTNRTYGLLLLHLPPPHKPGIYLPSQDRFTVLSMSKSTGYLNNLGLVDRELGSLRRAMETSGQWNKTWLLVSTDHAWRESRYYDGQLDLRVPFVVRAPGADKAITYSAQVNTVLTHDLILAILRGELTNQEDVAPWLDAHPRAEPTIVGNGQSE